MCMGRTNVVHISPYIVCCICRNGETCQFIFLSQSQIFCIFYCCCSYDKHKICSFSCHAFLYMHECHMAQRPFYQLMKIMQEVKSLINKKSNIKDYAAWKNSFEDSSIVTINQHILIKVFISIFLIYTNIYFT